MVIKIVAATYCGKVDLIYPGLSWMRTFVYYSGIHARDERLYPWFTYICLRMFCEGEGGRAHVLHPVVVLSIDYVFFEGRIFVLIEGISDGSSFSWRGWKEIDSVYRRGIDTACSFTLQICKV